MSDLPPDLVTGFLLHRHRETEELSAILLRRYVGAMMKMGERLHDAEDIAIVVVTWLWQTATPSDAPWLYVKGFVRCKYERIERHTREEKERRAVAEVPLGPAPSTPHDIRQSAEPEAIQDERRADIEHVMVLNLRRIVISSFRQEHQEVVEEVLTIDPEFQRAAPDSGLTPGLLRTIRFRARTRLRTTAKGLGMPESRLSAEMETALLEAEYRRPAGGPMPLLKCLLFHLSESSQRVLAAELNDSSRGDEDAAALLGLTTSEYQERRTRMLDELVVLARKSGSRALLADVVRFQREVLRGSQPVSEKARRTVRT